MIDLDALDIATDATDSPAAPRPTPRRVQVCTVVDGDPICPMTGSTTCTSDEKAQRRCPAC